MVDGRDSGDVDIPEVPEFGYRLASLEPERYPRRVYPIDYIDVFDFASPVCPRRRRYAVLIFSLRIRIVLQPRIYRRHLRTVERVADRRDVYPAVELETLVIIGIYGEFRRLV